MKPFYRKTFRALLASVCLAWCAHAPAAEPVRVILPFGPGSGTDNTARPLFEQLGRELNQVFVIDNRPGASGMLAAQAAARSTPDGATLFFTTNTTQTINPVLFKKLPYDPIKDFKPVVSIFTSPYLLLVRKDLPVNTLPELLDWVRANPDQASYGWGAAVSQMAGANFLKRTGISAVGVPYKSSPQAVTDLIGGQLTYMFLDLAAAAPVIKGERVKALLITSSQRFPSLPNIPTAAEAGLNDFEVAAWAGILAPAGTPDDKLNRIAASVTKAMKTPEIIQRLETCCVPAVMQGQVFADYMARDHAKWQEWAELAGITPE